MRIHKGTAMRLLLIIYLLTAVGAHAGEKPSDPAIEETEINGTRIPEEIYSAYKDLDHMLSPAIKKEMAEGSEEALAKQYRELAGWLRENWGSQRDSTLRRWLHARGIDNPDDIPAIILKSYRRYLRSEPLGLDTVEEDDPLK